MERVKNQELFLAIEHVVRGKATPEEEKTVYLWIRENTENRKALFTDKDLWDGLELNSAFLQGEQFDQWYALEAKILQRKAKSERLTGFFRMVAVFIIALGAGWFGHSYFKGYTGSKLSMEERTVSASPGQIKEIFLPDGTHVWLNSDSRITFPSIFSSDRRGVSLSGEAYFEVMSDTDHPFLVTTQNHTVKVTGTRFNICEYPESQVIETTLEEGKVKIISGNVFRDLLPGQQSSFFTETAEIRINEADFEIFTAWKEGRYEFHNEPVAKVFQIIERWWDVDIQYPEKIKDERISGVLRRYKPLEQHFEVIRQLIPLTVRMNSDIVIIELK